MLFSLKMCTLLLFVLVVVVVLEFVGFAVEPVAEFVVAVAGGGWKGSIPRTHKL